MFPDNTMFANTTISIVNVVMIFGIMVAAAGSWRLLKANKELHEKAVQARNAEAQG